VKPQLNKDFMQVVGGVEIKMQGKANEIYFDCKIIDSNQNWKYKWFYMNNHLPALSKPSMFAPKHDDCLKDEPAMEECLHLPKLLEKIVDLKKKGLTSERVTFSFMKRQILPLIKMDHLGNKYTGVDDISRLIIEDSNNNLIMERLDKNFRDMKPGIHNRCEGV
jgi:hypothetical protein